MEVLCRDGISIYSSKTARPYYHFKEVLRFFFQQMSSEGKEEAAVIMLPGDTLDLPGDVAAVRVGPGLRQKQQQQQQEQQKMLLEAYRVGILRHKTKPTDAYWLDSSHKHVRPCGNYGTLARRTGWGRLF